MSRTEVLEKSRNRSRAWKKKWQSHRAGGLLSRWPLGSLSDRCWTSCDTEVSLIRELVEANSLRQSVQTEMGRTDWLISTYCLAEAGRAIEGLQSVWNVLSTNAHNWLCKYYPRLCSTLVLAPFTDTANYVIHSLPKLYLEPQCSFF